MSKRETALNPNEIQWNGEMPPTKIEGFLREFPWVRKFVKGPISQVFVSRVDPTTLKLEPDAIDIDDFIPVSRPDRGIYLLDADGNIVNGEITIRRKKYVLFGKMITVRRITYGKLWYGVSVGEKLSQLGDSARNVRFILWYRNYDKGDDTSRFGAVIVYRTPKGVTINEWIKRQIQMEASRFSQEISSIDAEAS